MTSKQFRYFYIDKHAQFKVSLFLFCLSQFKQNRLKITAKICLKEISRIIVQTRMNRNESNSINGHVKTNLFVMIRCDGIYLVKLCRLATDEMH